MPDFDPYYQWLAIPPKDQPPNHYRLLGVDLFESNAGVISNAADQRMAHIRLFQTGKHSHLSKRLLNEISAARVCLLNPEKKAVYDGPLRQQASPPAPPPPPVVAYPPARGDLNSFKAPAITPRTRPVATITPKESQDKNRLWLGLGVLGVVALFLAFLAFNWGRGGKDAPGTASESTATTSGQTVGKRADPKPQDRREEPGQPPDKRAKPKRPDVPSRDTVKPESPGPPSEPSGTKGQGPPEQPTRPIPPSSVAAGAQDEVVKEPPKGSPKEKSPVPASIEQEKALATIREIYKGEDHATLPKKLIDKAKETQDSTDRFVLLKEAKDVATATWQCKLAFEAIDEMSSAYDISSSETKAGVLEQATKRPRLTPEQKMTIAEAALHVIDEAIREDNFDTARQTGRRAVQLARLSRDKDLLQEILATNKKAEAAAKVYADAREAMATLKEKPDDPDVRLSLGNYFCFTKGNWDKGLPMLVLGSDEKLKALATRDIVGADSANEQVQLGDLWWDAGVKQRAVYWYERALPRLTGLEKARVDSRVIGVSPTPEARERFAAKGRIYVSCDDAFELYVNGTKVVEGNQLKPYECACSLSKRDIITVKCQDVGYAKGFCCVILFVKGQSITTGTEWKAYSPKSEEEWFTPQNIGKVFSVVPADTPVKDAIKAASGVAAPAIWGQGNPCYLFYVVP
ncbi:MAG: tetratricopeptide repeat protein [Pirellulales bacterium]